MPFFTNHRSNSKNCNRSQMFQQENEDTDEEDFKRLPNASSSKLTRTFSSGSSNSNCSSSSCQSNHHFQHNHQHQSQPNLPSFSTLWTLDDKQDAATSMSLQQQVASKTSKSQHVQHFNQDMTNCNCDNVNNNQHQTSYQTNEQQQPLGRPHTYTIVLKWNKSKKKFCLENDISYFSQFTRRTCLLTFVQWHWIKTNIKQPCSKLYQDMLSSGGSSFFNKQPSPQKFQECEKQLRNHLLRAQSKLNSNCSEDFDYQCHRQPLFVSHRDVALVLNECSTCRGHLFESVELELKYPKDVSDPTPPKILVHMKEFTDDSSE